MIPIELLRDWSNAELRRKRPTQSEHGRVEHLEGDRRLGTVVTERFGVEEDRAQHLLKEGKMVAVEGGTHERVKKVAHPEESISIIMALAATFGSLVFFWLAPGYSPQHGIIWAVPGWIASIYLFLQILFLLVSATQIRTLGVLDTIIAIFPVVAGLVLITEWLIGHIPFSGFQLNALAMVICTSLAEFLLTVWIRFVLNRRTISIDAN